MSRRTDKVTGAVTDFTWDHENRLTTITFKTAAAGTITDVIRYTYDALGRRIQKKVDVGNDSDFELDERYVYNGDRLSLVFDAAGSLTNRYLYADAIDAALAEETHSGSSLTGVEWLLGDHQGSIRDVLDDAGDEVAHFAYDAFGNLVDHTPNEDLRRFAYSGQAYDAETGYYYMAARYYDPTIGRFLSEDPLGFDAGDVNLYRYVNNSPILYVDPTGLRISSPLQMLGNFFAPTVTSLANLYQSASNLGTTASKWASSTWSTVASNASVPSGTSMTSVWKNVSSSTPNDRVMTRLQDLDPAAHAFAQHNGISLAERPSGSWFSELFRKEMEVTSHDGGSASGKSYTTTFRSDMSEYERLTALQGEIHRSPAFQEFVELNGLQPVRQTTISAAPGSAERIANHHNETVAYMERAGATSQEIQSYRNAVWMNDQFGPGGTAETLLHFAAAKPGGYNSGGTRVMASQGRPSGNANSNSVPIHAQKQAGHIPGTPQYINRTKQGKTTSAFFGQTSGDAWTQKAWQSGTPTGDPNIKIYNAGVAVGTGPNGGMQKQIRVVQDSQGRIHGTPWGPEH